MPYSFSNPGTLDLSRSQRLALLAPAEDVLIISGCPGSGKTTVALLRSKGRQADQRYHYTVWANLLYGFLINSATSLDLAESHFSTFFTWFWRTYKERGFDRNGYRTNVIVNSIRRGGEKFIELQLDEGQDIPLEVRCALSMAAKKMVICMDPAQDVQGYCDKNLNEIQATVDHLRKEYKRSPKAIQLSTNWRNTKAIFEFAKQIVPELNNQTAVNNFSKEKGDLPLLYELEDLEEIIERIVKIIRNEPGRNIGILDDSLETLKKIDRALRKAGMNTTIYNSYEHKQRDRDEKRKFFKTMSNVILSTFTSSKGLEFSTVIIADISKLSDDLTKKKGYYVGCTRAQENLILFRDTSSMQIPDWFQQIETGTYKKPPIRTSPNLF